MPDSEKYVYLFNEIEAAEGCAEAKGGIRALLGGKGANLAEMTRLGIPVPPGFTVTTEACNAYLAAGELPEEIWAQELVAIAELEKSTGKRFGNPDDPLLLSCRSGARFSMPGMMDTILNIGLNENVVAGLSNQTGGPRFVYDLYRRLIQMFSGVVMDVPEDLFEEVLSAQRRRAAVESDSDLSADDLRDVSRRFLETVRTYTGDPFPSDPVEQLRMATAAVFREASASR